MVIMHVMNGKSFDDTMESTGSSSNTQLLCTQMCTEFRVKFKDEGLRTGVSFPNFNSEHLELTKENE